MRGVHYLFLSLLFSCSCQSEIKRETEKTDKLKTLSKLGHLYLLSADSVIDAYDLSNDSIADFPDLSCNALHKINICEPLFRILLSHNDLVYANFNHKNLQYLDISYNSRMPEKVAFEPMWIDTLVREGVADGKELSGAVRNFFDYLRQKRNSLN